MALSKEDIQRLKTNRKAVPNKLYVEEPDRNGRSNYYIGTNDNRVRIITQAEYNSIVNPVVATTTTTTIGGTTTFVAGGDLSGTDTVQKVEKILNNVVPVDAVGALTNDGVGGLTWTVPGGTGTVTSVSALTLGTTGTDLSSSVANSTTTPVITLNVPTASATNRGALSSADWTTFNNKQGTITLTTTGTSGAATFTSNTLNIPNYGSALSGYVPYTGATGNVNLGVNSFIADNSTFNTEMSPSYFGVQNNASTIFALLEYNQLTLTDNTLPSGLSISATGITFPDLTVQTTAAVTDVTATSPITSSGGATPDISTSMSTNKLIGRGTAGTGVMEEITLGTNLSLTGTTLNASGGGGGIPIATAGGTVDVITATYSPALTLSDKVVCAFVATGANTTTTPTFNADGLGAKTIVKQGGQALVAGDIPNALAICILEYNLANTRWELMNPAYGKTATNILKGNFGATWDGQGGVIGTGAWQEIVVPYAGTITDFVIDSYTPATGIAVSGSIIIELYRSGASIIGAGNKPTLAAASTSSAAVAGWTSTAVAAGDKLYAYVSSTPVSCLKVTCTFNITKT